MESLLMSCVCLSRIWRTIWLTQNGKRKRIKIFAAELKKYYFRKLKDFEKDQEMIKSDTESYISNPLHAFLLIKRFTNDSFLIKEKIVMSNARFNSQTSSLSLSKIDLQGAVEGLDRLQMAYDLKTEDFTAGIIDGDKYNVSLSAHDLYVIAVELFNGKRFSRSLEYLEEALIKAKESVEFIEVSEANILLVMAEVYQEIGNYEKAIQTIDKVLKLRPENMKDLIQKREDLQLKLREEKVIVPQTPKEKLELRLTRKVCNGDVHRSNAHLSELHCRYESKSAFSKIAPYKLEEQHLDPLIVIYHDIISDNDIKIVKQLATDKLYQSVVFSDTGELLISSNIRISEVAWFEDESHQVIERLSKRIEDITGLSMSSSENLQIQKYGIGGFYKSHYDFTANPEISAKRFLGGDRIATFLIYVRRFFLQIYVDI